MKFRSVVNKILPYFSLYSNHLYGNDGNVKNNKVGESII